MDSEKRQRIQKRELIGETLEAEDLPLEHTAKKQNKNVTVIKKTPCAYVSDLKETIIAYVEDNARYSEYFDQNWLQTLDFQTLYQKVSLALFLINSLLNFSTGQLTWHDGHIPENLLYVKLGGDHGQGSMKFEFQLANVVKPNSSKKTVVFAIFEAKDTRNNMRAITTNYNDQLEDLRQTIWR